jgi:hypothetical protein
MLKSFSDEFLKFCVHFRRLFWKKKDSRKITKYAQHIFLLSYLQPKVVLLDPLVLVKLVRHVN